VHRVAEEHLDAGHDAGGGLREEVIWDENTGVLLNGNMYDYKPTTYLDQPKIEVVPVETRAGGGCYGATGTAHSHFDRGLFTQAIHNATGAWVETAPATPDKVLAALGKI
jgi:CO/xanthine dehydrogenase Mo-binding subunit